VFNLFSFICNVVTIIHSIWMLPRWFSWWLVCRLQISYNVCVMPVC